MAIRFKVGLEVGCPSARPVGEHAELLVVELIAAVLGGVGQGGGVNPALVVAFLQACQRSFHFRLGETINIHAILEDERRVRILIEFRQVVGVGRFVADEAGSRGAVSGLAIHAQLREGVEHGSVFFPIGRRLGDASLVHPRLLDVGDAAVAAGRREAVEATVNLQAFDNAVAGEAAGVLRVGILPRFGHIPQRAVRREVGIIGRRHDEHVRPLVGVSHRLLHNVVVSGVVRLVDDEIDARQFFPARFKSVAAIRLIDQRGVNHDGNLFRLCYFLFLCGSRRHRNDRARSQQRQRGRHCEELLHLGTLPFFLHRLAPALSAVAFALIAS